MANQDLGLIYASTKRDAEIAISRVRMTYNLPAYLMVGIVEGILSRLKDECLIELTTSSERYAESLKQEAEEKGEENAAFANNSDS